MRYPDILTLRLRLVRMNRELLRADFAADRLHFSRLLRAEVPAAWPPEHWEPHCFPFIARINRDHAHARGWSRYVVLRNEPMTLVGTVGAFPRTRTEAEVGYGFLPGWHGRGLATEAARALLTEVLRDELITTVSAQTFAGHTASIRVMERCGLGPVGPGDEEGTVRYGVERQTLESSLPPHQD